MIKEEGGRAGGIHVWIPVFEGMGADGRTEWENFFLLTKVRRFGKITGVKDNTNSILLSYY